MDEKRGRLITVLLVGGGVLVYAGTQASSFRPGQWSGALWAILLGLPFLCSGFCSIGTAGARRGRRIFCKKPANGSE